MAQSFPPLPPALDREPGLPVAPGAARMSTYHLHARMFEGPLAAPVRDELRVTETDSRREADAWARDRAAEGFTVWIFDHGRVPGIAGASDYRTVEQLPPASRPSPAAPAGPPPRPGPVSRSRSGSAPRPGPVSRSRLRGS